MDFASLTRAAERDCCEVSHLARISDRTEQSKSQRYPGSLIESMMELRPRQGNLRLVFRLFSLMRGLPSIRLK